MVIVLRVSGPIGLLLIGLRVIVLRKALPEVLDLGSTVIVLVSGAIVPLKALLEVLGPGSMVIVPRVSGAIVLRKALPEVLGLGPAAVLATDQDLVVPVMGPGPAAVLATDQDPVVPVMGLGPAVLLATDQDPAAVLVGNLLLISQRRLSLRNSDLKKKRLISKKKRNCSTRLIRLKSALRPRRIPFRKRLRLSRLSPLLNWPER